MPDPSPNSLEVALLKLTNLHASLGETVQSMAQKFDALLLRSPSSPSSSSPNPSTPYFPFVPASQHKMKLDISKFDGTDPYGWVFKINQYFQYHATPEHDRLTIVSFYMDGCALAWFQWMANNGQFTSWPAFVHALLHGCILGEGCSVNNIDLYLYRCVIWFYVVNRLFCQ